LRLGAALKPRPGAPSIEGGAVVGKGLFAAPGATIVGVIGYRARAVRLPRVRARSCGGPDTLSGAGDGSSGASTVPPCCHQAVGYECHTVC
jgi:hypothetical protein